MFKFDPEQPYNQLLDLPPKIEIESNAVLKKAIKANKYLAELKGTCLRLPNPDLLINTVILQESKDSSEIENIVTTQDALYKAVLSPFEQMPSETREVLNYKNAIYSGLEAMQQNGLLKASVAITIMQKIKNTTAGLRKLDGTRLAHPKTKKVIYSPPEPDHIPQKIKAWEEFMNLEDSLDPLVKMALMHYQFEAIHPFADGNGRTGRILNVLYLVNQGLLTNPVLYHSSYIIQHKSDYYRCLREVTEKGAWEAWIIFMLDAVSETSIQTLQMIERMLEIKDTTLEIVKGLGQKVPAYELNELLFSYPYIKIKVLEDHGVAKRQTASQYLQKLEEEGVLKSVKSGREVYYINHQLIDLLSRNN